MEEKIVKQKADQRLKKSIDRYKCFLEGFTLVEIMVVVVLVGLIAGFGIPAYEKLVRKSHERNAVLGLTLINQGNEVFSATSLGGQYWLGTNQNLTQINTGLSIDLKALDLTYDYDRAAPGAYTTTAAWAGAAGPFTVRVNQGPIIFGTNPCCLNPPGGCPSVPNCP